MSFIFSSKKRQEKRQENDKNLAIQLVYKVIATY